MVKERSIIKWENGNLYEGEFRMNHIEGNGYMVWYDLLEKEKFKLKFRSSFNGSNNYKQNLIIIIS